MVKMAYVCFNGNFIEEKEAVIPVMDKGYFFDFAVYSSLKVIQGKIFFPEYHTDRLLESAQIIDLGHEFTKENILDYLNLTIKKNDLHDAFLRIVLIGDAKENKKARLFIFPLAGVHYYPERMYKYGTKVITFNGERRFPTSKTKDLLLSFLAYREAEKESAADALLIDKEGMIREGTKSNFFAIRGNILISPPKDKILEGITKKIIFDICRDHFTLKEEDIPLSKVKEYDELFISSTLFNVLPINQIDEMHLNPDFSKTKMIQKLFQDFYRQKILK